MITGFEEITQPLTEYEQNTLLPKFIESFTKKIGKDKAVTNKTICEKLSAAGDRITDARVRKIINYIRNNNLVPGLIATSAGYYVSTDPTEVKAYIDSLTGRASAIAHVRDNMQKYFYHLQNTK